MTKVVVKDLKGRETVYQDALMTLHHSGALMVIRNRDDGKTTGVDTLLATIPANAYATARTVYKDGDVSEAQVLETGRVEGVTWVDGYGLVVSEARSKLTSLHGHKPPGSVTYEPPGFA